MASHGRTLGIIFKVVHLILVVTSMAGWFIFTAGFSIFYRILSPKDAPLPSIIGVSWNSVLSPMMIFGLSSIPLYLLLIIRIFLMNNVNGERISTSILMLFNLFYWLGLGTTVFCLALLLAGGLGDYLKNIFMLQQKHILVMAIGCTVSVIPYCVHSVVWPLTQLRVRRSDYRYHELVQSTRD